MKRASTIYEGTGIRWQPLHLDHLTFNRRNRDEPGLLVDLSPSALRLYLLVQVRSGSLAKKVDLTNLEVRKFAGLDRNSLESARRVLREFGLIEYEALDARREKYRYEILDPRTGKSLGPVTVDGDDWGQVG